ncbi:MAG: NAD-dependent epimerase/dehydratase family protein [Candidatus Bathyarchaeia archaeon]
MGRIVITGAGGFIGSAMLQSLTRYRRGEVLAIDLPTSKLHLAKGYSVAYCDILSDLLRKHIHAGDRVLHLAAISTFKAAEEDRLRALAVNVGGTLKIVEACNDAGAERLVFSSTGSVISPKAEVPFKEDAPLDPPNYYGWTKALAEDVIKRYCRVPWIILRYGYVYGATKRHGAIGAFIQLLRQGKPPTIYGGKQTNDFTYIEDIEQANRLALLTEHTHQIYHIGSGRANSILDVYDLCADALNSKIKPVIKAPRPSDYPVFLYDIEKARKLLEYEPQWTLKQGINRMVEILESESPKSQ